MPLQPPNFFGLVDPTNPVGTDSRTISDDYHRMALASMQQQAPNWAGEITATHSDVNLLAGIAAGPTQLMLGVGGTTVIYFYNATVPPGWTINQPDTNLRNLTIAGSGDTGGTIDGSDDPSNMTKDISSTPSGSISSTNTAHVHPVSLTTGGPSTTASESGANSLAARSNHTHSVSGNSGGMSANESHAHNFTGDLNTDDVTFNPRRAVGVLGTLDA